MAEYDEALLTRLCQGQPEALGQAVRRASSAAQLCSVILEDRASWKVGAASCSIENWKALSNALSKPESIFCCNRSSPEHF